MDREKIDALKAERNFLHAANEDNNKQMVAKDQTIEHLLFALETAVFDQERDWFGDGGIREELMSVISKAAAEQAKGQIDET